MKDVNFDDNYRLAIYKRCKGELKEIQDLKKEMCYAHSPSLERSEKELRRRIKFLEEKLKDIITKLNIENQLLHDQLDTNCYLIGRIEKELKA